MRRREAAPQMGIADRPFRCLTSRRLAALAVVAAAALTAIAWSDAGRPPAGNRGPGKDVASNSAFLHVGAVRPATAGTADSRQQPRKTLPVWLDLATILGVASAIRLLQAFRGRVGDSLRWHYAVPKRAPPVVLQP
jgi:hypothetical protein